MGFASCLVDLPNIELFATGSFKNRIELWVLRTRNDSPQADEGKDVKKGKGGKTKAVKAAEGKAGDRKKDGDRLLDAMSIGKINEKEKNMEDDVSKLKKKTLCGHNKAIREIAYSEAYKILISVGFDFHVFLWCPYIEQNIQELKAHEVPLVGVNCPPGLDCFITCDTKGVVNVWNIQDYSCMQNFSVQNVNNVTSMRVVQKHRRLIIGSRVFKVYEYHKPFIPDVSDDNPILCALFSDIRFEFYIAGGKQITIWNAREGRPTRCFKNCFESSQNLD